jgi:hypothetical protein
MEEGQRSELGLFPLRRSRGGESIYVKNIFSISFINGLWRLVGGEKFSLKDPKPRKFYELGKA